MYILDHSTYLSVSNCEDCQIFVGECPLPCISQAPWNSLPGRST